MARPREVGRGTSDGVAVLMAKRATKTPAERMLEAKRRHVARLREEIASEHRLTNGRIQKIERRIRISQTIIDALEKGTLKP